MGQLLKIQDYVSRYEVDIIRYTNQFVRLKKQQWQTFRENWENRLAAGQMQEVQEEEAAPDEDSRQLFSRIKHWLRKKNEVEMEELAEPVAPFQPGILQFSPQLVFFPETEDQLKKLFLDQLFRFQLKWASSTLLEDSPIPAALYFDADLKYFLQRFPDTFLLLYKPVFVFKKAILEMETILISPLAVWCLTFLEEEKDAVFFGSKSHFWEKRAGKNAKKILNPVIALDRTEKIVRGILKQHGVTIPIEKGLICRNGYITWPDAPQGLHILDKRPHMEWFRHQRNLRSPLKYMQLKAAQALLNECLAKSVARKRRELEDHSRDGE
ncbi:hypothetical protein BpJC7_06960 [Weizmannia acidilactici]|uniref:NERD domain-containing protein n=1 Tax=Weizmannia acidilactici TaxID=2607726 RepID=A0A5J4JBT8_9BACI|nr:NERD domain-containing protein [Weizmannia acidilactici]GER66461.1 hypothetical protein BpJC4_09320 [Weizmannia acidilactici]GER69393.1 hypothetical protein BpJC7_06960 [Weizmannia acidilactici]GER72279.1 hypothetical protein BpPP18_03460 [Weizmannia acidilactici]